MNTTIFFPLGRDTAKWWIGDLKQALSQTLEESGITCVKGFMYWEDATQEAADRRFKDPVIFCVTITAEQQKEMVGKEMLNGAGTVTETRTIGGRTVTRHTRRWLISVEGCEYLCRNAQVEIRNFSVNDATAGEKIGPSTLAGNRLFGETTIYVPMPEWQGKSFLDNPNQTAFKRLFGKTPFKERVGERIFRDGMYGYKHRLDAFRVSYSGKEAQPIAMLHITLSAGLTNELWKKVWLFDNSSFIISQAPEWWLNKDGMETVLRRAKFAVEFVAGPGKIPSRPDKLWEINPPGPSTW